jgi:hypothetical protein
MGASFEFRVSQDDLKMTWRNFGWQCRKAPIQIPKDFKGINGADDPIRTDDLLITSELLYQLSYVGPGGVRWRSVLLVVDRLSPIHATPKSAIAHCPPMGSPSFERFPTKDGWTTDGANDLWGRRGAECSAGAWRRHRCSGNRQGTRSDRAVNVRLAARWV